MSSKWILCNRKPVNFKFINTFVLFIGLNKSRNRKRMKKLLLSLTCLAIQLTLFAQTEASITLTAGVDGNSRNFSFIVNTPDTKLNIDWGDGNLVETEIISNDPEGKRVSTTITGTPIGEGKIKIYGSGITYFEAYSKISGAKITAMDVSRCTELEYLHANTNSLTGIDLSKNTKLKTINLATNMIQSINLEANTELYDLNLEGNKLESINLQANQKLTLLRLSKNIFGTLDLSSNLQLKTVYLLNCGLTQVNFGANATENLYISLNNNRLTSFDATTIPGLATAKGELSIRNNELTNIKIGTMYRLNVGLNRLALNAIPTTVSNRLTYHPQKAMPIAEEINVNEELDLSAQTQLNGITATPQITTFIWKTVSGTELQAGTDYTENNGKFTFLKAQTDSVYATLSTPAFPYFTGSNAFVTTKMAVKGATTSINEVDAIALQNKKHIYTIDGRYVGTDIDPLPKGIYITDGKKICKH